jgi:hypothetical protein
MSDTRAAIRELRSLSEKRSTDGLTEQERSRLAELRERLGLPSEPAEVRTGGPRPGGTPAPSPSPIAATGAPVAAAALPRLDASGAALLPRLEPDAPPAPEPAPAPTQPLADSASTAPAAEAEAEGGEDAPIALVGDLPPEPTQPEPVLLLAPDPGSTELEAAPTGLELDATAVEAESTAPEQALEALEAAVPPEAALPLLTSPVEVTRFEHPSPSEAATDPAIDLLAFVAASPESALPEPPEPASDAGDSPVEAVLDAVDPAAVPPDALLPSEEASTAWAADPGEAPADPQDAVEMFPLPPPEAFEAEPAVAAEPVAHRLSLAERIDAAVDATEGLEAGDAATGDLAERIDAAVEGLEAGGAATGDSADWGAVPLTAEALAPADLGAIPLDVADPATELGFSGDAAPIELSSADVILLEGESAVEEELGGQPDDRVPLAELHEFVGEQPADPRAIAFDDQGEEPTFAPEELQATEAELATAPQAFHPGELEPLPELESEPEPAPRPPAPAAPRIVVPRPPAPRPARAPLSAAAPPEPPLPPTPRGPSFAPPPEAPAAPARVVASPRPSVPPPPPAAAYVMGEDGRRLPALSAARPEPPQLAHQFGHSGPFARNKAVLLADAPLDVMEATEEVTPDSPPPPATDVATGAEVFGGTFLSPTFVEGEHRVVLHTLEGQVRRGTVRDLDLLDPVIRLAQPGRPPEAIAADRVKAIFFMQEPGTPPPPSTGRRIRVGFSDGRQIVGFSEDVDAGEQGFFLVPADTRTHTARIYVFRAGVQSISAA